MPAIPLISDLIKPVLELPETFKKEDFSYDLMCGLTVMIVALPQVMAYALIAKINPIYGLYGAIVMGIVGALFGSSHHLNTGPTNAISILVAGVMFPFVAKSTSYPLEILFLLTFMVGVIQLALGMVRLGVLVNYVPHSLIVGFTAGAGVLIAMQQFNTFFGISAPTNINMPTVQKVIWTIQNINLTNKYALGLGVLTMIIIIACKMIGKKYPKLERWLPGPLIAVVTATLLVAVLRLDKYGVKITGDIPSAFPIFGVIHFSLANINALFSGALIITIVGLVEAVAISKSIASRTGQKIDTNQEFVGQGMANIVGSFFSCFPGSGSFTRTAVNYQSGGHSKLSNIMSGILVMVVVVLTKPFIKYTSNACLAGVLMVVAYSMIDKKAFREVLKVNRNDALIMIVTAVVTVFAYSLEYAIYAGLALAIVLYLKETGKANVRNLILVKDDSGQFVQQEVYICDHEKCKSAPIAILQPVGSLYFGSSNDLEKKFSDLLTNNASVYILKLDEVNMVDVTSLEVIKQSIRQYLSNGKYVLISGVCEEVYKMMEKANIVTLVGRENIVTECDQALSTNLVVEKANAYLSDREKAELYIKKYL